jgi:hypothetical protein
MARGFGKAHVVLTGRMSADPEKTWQKKAYTEEIADLSRNGAAIAANA